MAWLFKLRGQQCFFWLFVCVLWIKLRSFTGEWWEISVLNKLPLTLFLLLWDQLQADQVDEHLHLSSYHNISLTDHLNQHVWSKGVRVHCEEGFVSVFSMLLNKALMMERRCQLLNSGSIKHANWTGTASASTFRLASGKSIGCCLSSSFANTPPSFAWLFWFCCVYISVDSAEFFY